MYTTPLIETTMSAYKFAMDIHGEAGRVARYLSAKFWQLRKGTGELLFIENHWKLDYVAELDLAANILHQAMENQSKCLAFITKIIFMCQPSKH